jgi:hypothetical protein
MIFVFVYTKVMNKSFQMQVVSEIFFSEICNMSNLKYTVKARIEEMPVKKYNRFRADFREKYSEPTWHRLLNAEKGDSGTGRQVGVSRNVLKWVARKLQCKIEDLIND